MIQIKTRFPGTQDITYLDTAAEGFRPAALGMHYRPMRGTRIAERLAAPACTRWSVK